MINLILKILFISFLVVLYYKIIKDQIVQISPRIAQKTKFVTQYPLNKVIGVIEIILIAATHFLFLIILCLVLGIQLKLANFTFVELIYGVMLGIGIMATSMLSCRILMEGVKLFFPNKIPHSMKSWIVMARGGWMRHHTHNLQLFPVIVALSIAFVQIGSEEAVFRGVLLPYFVEYGKLTAGIISTALFVVMQMFQTPNLSVSIFPITGALVCGSIFTFLYLQTQALLPLIVAHFTFFALTVL